MRILILNQAFYPDVVATAQYATELACALAEAGHDVYALAGSRGYDDPSKKFPSRDFWNGIHIIRVPSLGLGKSSKLRRIAEFTWFLVACSVRLMVEPRVDVVVSLTSPPIVSFLASWVKILRGSKLVYWTMDLNPDEAIASGWMRGDSLVAKVLAAAQVFSIRRSDIVVVLDRFMEKRIKNTSPHSPVQVIPPWSHDSIVFNPQGREQFRERYGLSHKFVVMYAGNHSPCHPLQSILCAAEELRNEDDIAFLFVGGGSELPRVRQFAADRGLHNVITLPYQPKEILADSLGAADMHVVVMGDPFVGIIHPCKIYNILALGAPFLYIGPEESHIGDRIRDPGASTNCVGSIRHGDIEGIVRSIHDARKSARYRMDVSGNSMPGCEERMLVSAIESIMQP